MNINFKSGYFWGAIFAIFFLIANVVGVSFLQKKMATNMATFAFSKFEMRNLKGENIKLKDLANEKKIFLNFWSTWCGPCLKEFPVIQQSYIDTKEEYVYIMVSDEKIETIKKFTEKSNYSFIFMQVNPFTEYGIFARPVTFILDESLEIINTFKGAIPYENSDVLSSFLKQQN